MNGSVVLLFRTIIKADDRRGLAIIYFCIVSSFQSEIISFIESLESNHTIESWGLLIEERGVGFVFNEINKDEKLTSNLPTNLHLIHLWEDLWSNKKEIVKSRFTSFFGKSKRVFARNTKIVKLNKIELLAFLKQNHLNEPANAKHKYGLVFGDALVAVAAFSASCPIHREEVVYRSHQLIRFCNKNGFTVVGGLSKLISHFIKLHNPEDVMSYADLDWSNGNSYTRLGFNKIGVLAPQTFYIDPVSMQRFYKMNDLEEKKSLLKFTNQGSIKYLLDLKKSKNG